MTLGEIILENERQNAHEQNRELVFLRLKEMIFNYPKEVTEVIEKSGLAVHSVLPKEVLFAIVMKHIRKNSAIRENMAKMLLDLDGYSGAVGWVPIVTGALSAISSVMTGISRSKDGQTSETDINHELEKARLREEIAKKERATKMAWGIGIGLATIGMLILFLVMRKKALAYKAMAGK